MTRLSRMIRNLLERMLGWFHEGSDTPARLLEEPRLFRALAQTTPTEEEWEAFCIQAIDDAYQAGFVRGYYWCERSWEPDEDPEQILARDQSLAADPRWANVLARPLDARRMAERNDRLAQAAAAGVDLHIEDVRDWDGEIRDLTKL